MTRTSSLFAAALAVAMTAVMTAPALAGTATLTHRESISHIRLIGAHGPTAVEFSDGSLLPITDLHTGLIEVNGAASGSDQFSVFSVTFDAIWDQRQDFNFRTLGSDAVLQASGALDVSMQSTGVTSTIPISVSPATQYYTSRNWQAFEFTLDADTLYSFTGETFGGQSLQMHRWAGADWVTAPAVISPGQGVGISNSGVLVAGLYRLRNTPNDIFRSQTAVTSNAWDYTLTLHNTVAAVPEPATLASMLAGLAAIGLWLRRRRRV